jgi:hypothetical protein
MAHAKTRPSLWLEGFPILSVVHPHNRTLESRPLKDRSLQITMVLDLWSSNAPDPFLCVRSFQFRQIEVWDTLT